MNRPANIVAVLAIGLGLLAAGLHAQSRGSQRRTRRSWGRPQGPSLSEALAKMRLTDSKQRQVHQILSAEKDLRDSNSDEYAELEEELREARESRSAQRARDIQSEMRRLRSDDQARPLEQVKQILSVEEQAELDEIMSKPGRAETVGKFLRSLGPLNLNIKQEAMVEKVMEQAMDRIRSVLTTEQRQELQEALDRPEPTRRTGRMGSMQEMGSRWRNMTEQQRSAVMDVGRQYRERMANASAEEQAELRREMFDKMRQAMDQAQATSDEEPYGEEDSDSDRDHQAGDDED